MTLNPFVPSRFICTVSTRESGRLAASRRKRSAVSGSLCAIRSPQIRCRSVRLVRLRGKLEGQLNRRRHQPPPRSIGSILTRSAASWSRGRDSTTARSLVRIRRKKLVWESHGPRRDSPLTRPRRRQTRGGRQRPARSPGQQNPAPLPSGRQAICVRRLHARPSRSIAGLTLPLERSALSEPASSPKSEVKLGLDLSRSESCLLRLRTIRAHA